MEIHKRNAIKNEKTVVDAFIQLSLVTYEAKSPKLITWNLMLYQVKANYLF